MQLCSLEGLLKKTSCKGQKDNGYGSKSWTLKLDSFDGQPGKFSAEGHLLSAKSGQVSVSVKSGVCPLASKGNSLYEVETKAGQQGHNFLVEIRGVKSKIRGKVGKSIVCSVIIL